MLTAGADRNKARRNTCKLLNSGNVGLGIGWELIIRCRIFDAGFIPARERFEHRFTAIEELNIPAWEAVKRSATTCVASTDLNFIKTCEDIKVADMDTSETIHAYSVLECKRIQPAAAPWPRRCRRPSSRCPR